jgi:hypothetical protein
MQSNFYPSSAPIADLPARASAPSHSAGVFLDSTLNKSPLSPREYEVARACLRRAAKIRAAPYVIAFNYPRGVGGLMKFRLGI